MNVKDFFKKWASICRVYDTKEKQIFTMSQLEQFAQDYHEHKMKIMTHVNASWMDAIQEEIWDASASGEKIQELSDGFHSFNDLYAYRKAYNALLFNEWAKHTLVGKINNTIKEFKKPKYNVQKSKNHSDGTPCFDGTYFVVLAELPTGQISNHYKMKYWDDFKIPEVDIPTIEYDGHTAEQALQRMEDYLKMK